MDWTSFGVALAGLLSTSIVSIIGIYFTHKARTKNYRELLYEKQLELVIGLMELAQLMELDAELVVGADTDSEREAFRHAFNDHYLAFRDLERKGTALLPVELYTAVREVFASASDLAIKISDDEETIEVVHKLIASNARFGLVAREFMGVDTLSTQSRSLFTNEEHVEAVVEIDRDSMVKRVAEARSSKSLHN